MDKKELQVRLDVEKWILSENKHYDLCGSFNYCAFCNIDEENPCANATIRRDKTNKPKTQLDENGYPINILVRTFSEKVEDSNEVLKERYSAISNELLSYKKVTHRVSEKCDNYRAGRGNLIAKITVAGKSLRVNFPLDPLAPKYEGRKTPHRNLSDVKTYADVPFQFRITSELSLRRCFALIDEVAEIKGLEKKRLKSVNKTK